MMENIISFVIIINIKCSSIFKHINKLYIYFPALYSFVKKWMEFINKYPMNLIPHSVFCNIIGIVLYMLSYLSLMYVMQKKFL
jgi:hypothetical protein